MSFRKWINAIRRQVASLGEPENEFTRWRKALSDFGYPYDIVSAASANEALASARVTGKDSSFVPVVIVPGHWNSERITPTRRVMRAQEMVHEAFDAAYGRQFLTDGVLAMYDDLEIDPDNPNPDDFDRLKPVKCSAPASGLSIVKRWDQVAIVRFRQRRPRNCPHILSGADGMRCRTRRRSLPWRVTGRRRMALNW